MQRQRHRDLPILGATPTAIRRAYDDNELAAICRGDLASGLAQRLGYESVNEYFQACVARAIGNEAPGTARERRRR